MNMPKRLFLCLLLASCASAQELVKVVSKNVERTVQLPGEFLPYQRVAIYARVPAFVDKIMVDRGSIVKEGQTLATLSAPEMAAHVAEAESRVQAIQLQRAEAEAKLAAAQSTYDKLKTASATPGAVAENELFLAQKSVDAARSVTQAIDSSAKAARSAVAALKDMESYLEIKAPFDGVITERLVHPGALVGPSSASPMLQLEQNARLRLVVAVPEAYVGGIVKGAVVPFKVAAFTGEKFEGRVARSAQTLDPRTRSMAVEMDVANSGGKLGPGMYPEVQWPVRKPHASLLVPPSSIVTNTERTFVIRVRDGKAEWINVTRGAASGDLVEVLGALNAEDQILKRGTEEIREGAALKAK